MRPASVWIAVGVALVGIGCGPTGSGAESAADRIELEGLAQGIRDLAADSMGGRAPASVGEERTIAYLIRRFDEIGLEPAGPDGSWMQEVSLVSLDSDAGAGATVVGQGTRQSLVPGVDFVAVPGGLAAGIELDASPLVFAGYGIVAPEIGWNDYEGLDLRGRTVVVLVNDPGYATGDERFGGRTMTYYGRWTYKYEEAKRHGAAAIMIVHQEGPAGYPWDVVKSGWSGPQFMLASDESDSGEFVQGWISEQTARTIFERGGLDFDSLAVAAGRVDFRPADLNQRLTLALRNDVERSVSHNVLARLPGRTRPEEHIVYMGHWDHLGIDSSLDGDTIYNGALDNASGISGLLELAEAFSALAKPPERSVLFLALTAEEQGLLGSRHYTAHPTWPLSEAVAAINVDGLNIYGPTRDVIVVGHGRSELDDVLAGVAAMRERTLRPDPDPEKGYFFRSDHFEFARRGVPAIFPGAGLEDLRYGEDWARARHEQYTAERYHKPGDEWDPAWNLEGAVEDLRLFFELGLVLSDSEEWPNWVVGSEFRQVRDASRVGSAR